MLIQTKLLDLLRDLPVCVGLGVKGDVHKIEQFYSEVSGINLEMAGFIDLSALALLAGYHMNARGMTLMGVQVLGAILNKCVSTTDNKWGYRWSDIPQALQVYGLDLGQPSPLEAVDSSSRQGSGLKISLGCARIMWNNNLVIQRLTDEMEFAVTYSFPEDSFSQELWVSQVP